MGRKYGLRDSMLTVSGLYNAFLAPGSPCELNIDHNLRNSLASRMTRAVSDDESMLRSLQEVVALFRDAEESVFKLMSSVRLEARILLMPVLTFIRTLFRNSSKRPNITAHCENIISIMQLQRVINTRQLPPLLLIRQRHRR